MRRIWSGTAIGIGLALGTTGLLRGSEPGRGPELASLVQRLGSPKFSEREEATEAIREIGSDAVDQLKQARESGDPEVRARSLRLLAAIEREVALSPTMVRLPEVPGQVEAIVGDLDKQTDFLIRTTSSSRLEPKSSAKAGERLTFWQAVERLGLEPNWSRLDPFRILELPVERPHLRLGMPSGAPVSVWNEGPFRVSVKEGQSTLQERFGQPADASHITLDLSLDIEPKLTIAGRPQVTLTEAVDSDGHSLLLDGFTQSSPISEDDLELTSMHVDATLNRLNRQDRSIARLRGVVDMEIEAPTSEPVEIPLDAQGAGDPNRGPGRPTGHGDGRPARPGLAFALARPDVRAGGLGRDASEPGLPSSPGRCHERGENPPAGTTFTGRRPRSPGPPHSQPIVAILADGLAG